MRFYLGGSKLHLELVSEIDSKSLDYDVEGMMDKIYTSQIGKEIAVLDENYLFF